MRMFNPPHPGEVIKEYIEGHSLTEIAGRLGVSRVAFSRLVNGKAAVTPEMALRLSALLKTTPDLWLNMQNAYDLWRLSQCRQFDIQPLLV